MRMSGMNERGVGKCIRWFFNHNNWSPDHQEISRSFAAIQERILLKKLIASNLNSYSLHIDLVEDISMNSFQTTKVM